MEAKKVWSDDAFQYFYNEEDQLVEEKEFYPQMGFIPRFRETYEYYE